MFNMNQESEIAVHKAHCFMVVDDEFLGCKYGPDKDCPTRPSTPLEGDELDKILYELLPDITDVQHIKLRRAIELYTQASNSPKEIDEIFNTLNGSGAHACYCPRSVDGGCTCALKDEYVKEAKALIEAINPPKTPGCITEIDLMTPGENINMQNHVLVGEKCTYCGVVFKNWEEFLKQKGFMEADLRTGKVIYYGKGREK